MASQTFTQTDPDRAASSLLGPMMIYTSIQMNRLAGDASSATAFSEG